MIPASLSVVYTTPTLSWQQELSAARLTPRQLAERLQLPPDMVETMAGGDRDFPIRATESYLQRIKRGNPSDPLLLQILPQRAECVPSTVDYCDDPVGDLKARKAGGLLQKYHGRALLITTAACAIHCRYCFRRHYPYPQQTTDLNLREVTRWLEESPTIHEMILSGGDPLILSDERLDHLLTQLECISHIHTIRIHSRLPVVLPARITTTLLQRLQQSPKNMVLVIHCNHPNELDPSTASALEKLKQHGVTLLNQSVLLKGVNDTAETLEQLSHKLFSQQVLPYYLHLLDRVSGSQHFDTEEAQAITIHHQLRQRLPGYLLPRLVRELEGEPSKTPIG